MRRSPQLLGLVALAAVPALAQQPFSPPPRGYLPTAEERQALEAGKRRLAERLQSLPAGALADRADVEVFLRAAHLADVLKLYTSKSNVDAVLRGLDEGVKRSELLAKGQRPWTTEPGRHLRGFYSRIDGSVQPYAVVLPAGFDAKATTPSRLDVVLHGRGPTEVTFLQQNLPAPGSAAANPPAQPFIELHPFGRANNGWRWSGETDVFEALAQVRAQYRTDPDRTLLRGFSMGGHGAWHIGVHYPSLWAAVSPGAGFSDTRRYQKLTDVPRYQERGWHIYDAVDYALNLFNTPFIAYGGDKDPQLQASLNMKEAAAKEGLPLNLIVGPDTEHRYHPLSLQKIMAQLATHRRDPEPRQVKFTTWTLKYNRCAWVTVDALGEHYQRADVLADASGRDVRVTTRNVTALTLGPVPGNASQVEIDGQPIPLDSGRSLRLRRQGSEWETGEPGDAKRKRHGLQGPIDDAFTQRFLVVRGTGIAWSPAVGSYASAALTQFQSDWRLGFRGEVPVKDDRDVQPEDWSDANLVLFGDPGSNSVLARIVERLPIRWTRGGIRGAGKEYGPDTVPVLVYPNPLNPKRYVVINSGHTFGSREIMASNAFLFPKLPDWAVLRPQASGVEVLAADYFDERWGFRDDR